MDPEAVLNRVKEILGNDFRAIYTAPHDREIVDAILAAGYQVEEAMRARFVGYERVDDEWPEIIDA